MPEKMEAYIRLCGRKMALEIGCIIVKMDIEQQTNRLPLMEIRIALIIMEKCWKAV